MMNTTALWNESLSNSTTTENNDNFKDKELLYLIIIGCLAGLSGLLIVINVAIMLYFKWYKRRRPDRGQESNANKDKDNIPRPRKRDPQVYENKYEIPLGREGKEAVAKKKRPPKQFNKNKGDNYANVEIADNELCYEPVDFSHYNK